jgi:hypothetical protein
VKFLNAWNLTNNGATKLKKTSDTHKLIKITLAGVRSQANPTLLLAHNERVFNFFQTTSCAVRRPYHNLDNYKLIVKLVSLNTKRGYKHKSIKIFYAVLGYVYSYFLEFDKGVYSEYPNYVSFFEFSRNFPEEFYKPDFFIKYIHLYAELVFLIKRIKPKKKLKKKKLQQKLLVSYLPGSTRSNITLRMISAYVNSSSTHDKVHRLGDSLLYLILAGKSSFIYKKKISMYNKLLEKKKFY